jgi:ABC-type transport system involved in cytochrome c biogenesis permease subunit
MCTISIVITIHLITLLVRELGGLCDSSEKGMIVTFFSITGFLVSRWASSGHFPLSNLYESLIFLSWALYILHTIPEIVTFQKIRTKSLDLSMLHPSEGGKKDQTDYG